MQNNYGDNDDDDDDCSDGNCGDLEKMEHRSSSRNYGSRNPNNQIGAYHTGKCCCIILLIIFVLWIVQRSYMRPVVVCNTPWYD